MDIQRSADLLVNAMKNIEELVYPDATLLPGFDRSVQLDFFSCGQKSVLMILRYYGKRCTHQSVTRSLHTTVDGTAEHDILRVFKENGLQCKIIKNASVRQLKNAIRGGCPVLLSLFRGWHWVVCYGFDPEGMFIADPSLDFMGVGSILCHVSNKDFRKKWDRWGVIVGDH